MFADSCGDFMIYMYTFLSAGRSSGDRSEAASPWSRFAGTKPLDPDRIEE